MVGNDVVDLGDPEVRDGPAHPRFDARVFSAAERDGLRAGGPDGSARWALWAAKEAAYKLAKKREPAAIFSPSRFCVTLDAALGGCVTHADRTVEVRLTRCGDAIHAVASEPDDADVLSGVEIAGPGVDASRAVRARSSMSRVRVSQSMAPAELTSSSRPPKVDSLIATWCSFMAAYAGLR